MGERRGLVLVGHGSRSAAGVDECRGLAQLVSQLAPNLHSSCGFIEFAAPDLDSALDDVVAAPAREVVAIPLVLLGAGHLKDDGPAALARARLRHPGVRFHYARDLGIHPLVLSLAQERASEAISSLPSAVEPADVAVVLVGRGSTDPDANADLAKVARLVWDGRGFGAVEPAFVSLAPPDVSTTLDRCRRLGYRAMVVVPYFLFTGILVDRIAQQAAAWAARHPAIAVGVGRHLGPDPRLARLVLERYEEALAGDARMNCDLCVYRLPLPGYEHKVGQPRSHHPHPHSHTAERR